MSKPTRSKDRLLQEITARLGVVKGPDARGEYTCWCPFHLDGKGKPPHRANLRVSERGFICHACDAKGSLWQLAQHLGIGGPGPHSRPDACYPYRDANGELLFQVCRFNAKRFLQRRPDGSGGWVWNLQGVPRVLYRLPELLAAAGEPVYLVEGEKDADRLAALKLVATTSPGGAGKWRPEYAEPLRDRDVIILPDNDDPGQAHAEAVAAALAGVAVSLKVVPLPEVPAKGDVSDWLDAGHGVEELRELVAAAARWEAAAQTPGTDEGEAHTSARESLAKQLVELAVGEGVELFHDERSEPQAAVPVAESRRVLQVSSRDFALWLSGLAWRELGKAISREALTTARGTLGAIARFEGEQHPLHVRSSWHEGAIWLDMDGQRAIRITPGGWEISTEPPILFRRFPHQRPLVQPVKGGDAWKVLRFVNLSDPASQLLLTCYLVAAMVPDIPVTALVVHGVQGSAKTTTLRVVKRLLDPSAVEVRGGVRDQTEYAQAAFQNRVVFFDNLTHVPDWLSDAICRTVTGEGWSKRTLFTDEDTTVFEYRRVVGLAGINLVADRADLLDRSLVMGLDPVAPDQRRDERTFWQEFEAEAPSILGGVLDALAKAMVIEPTLSLPRLPRMADFARWGAAAAEALGTGAEAFIKAYGGNVCRQNEAAVGASPVAQAVLDFMESEGEWQGTPGDLLGQLGEVAERLSIDTRDKSWPKSPSWLTRRLNEVQPNLLAMGLELVSERPEASHRHLTLRKVPENAVIAVTAVTEAPAPAQAATAHPQRQVAPAPRDSNDTNDSNDVTDTGDVSAVSDLSDANDSNDSNDSISGGLRVDT